MCYDTVALLNNFKEWKWQILRFYANKDFNLDSCRHDKTGSITNMALLWFVWSWQVKGQKKRLCIYIWLLGLLYSPNYWAELSHTLCVNSKHRFTTSKFLWRKVPESGARTECVCVCVCVILFSVIIICNFVCTLLCSSDTRMLEIHQY